MITQNINFIGVRLVRALTLDITNLQEHIDCGDGLLIALYLMSEHRTTGR